MFTTIWPIFGLICLGYGLARAQFPSVDFWAASDRLNYFVLFPALLMSSLADATPLDGQVLRFGFAVVIILAIACTLLFGWRVVRPLEAARFGPIVQGVVRFNTYLGLALCAMLLGQGVSTGAIYLAIAIPIVNVISIVSLSDMNVFRDPFGVIRRVLLNPLVLACLVGSAFNYFQIPLAYGVGNMLTLIGQGSLPLGLLCVGAALRPDLLLHDFRALAANVMGRLIVMPALAVCVAFAVGLDVTQSIVLVVFSSVPTAVSSYILTRQMGGDAAFMAAIITAQTVGAMVTIPAVVLVLQTLFPA